METEHEETKDAHPFRPRLADLLIWITLLALCGLAIAIFTMILIDQCIRLTRARERDREEDTKSQEIKALVAEVQGLTRHVEGYNRRLEDLEYGLRAKSLA
ncbi:hypothetical protein BST61_g6343 [Cercospora zeina]